jgi:hypothetical protein
MEKYKGQKWSGEKGKKFGHVGRQEDPYLPEAGQEATACSQCHALYQGKRWFFDETLYKRLAGTDQVREVVCPTCRKIKDHYPEGILTLSGDFWAQHEDEIVRRLKKETGRVSQRSVQDRIIRMGPDGNFFVVETTTEKLAQHLGHTVYKAFKGDLNFRWSGMDKFVRVYWSR